MPVLKRRRTYSRIVLQKKSTKWSSFFLFDSRRQNKATLILPLREPILSKYPIISAAFLGYLPCMKRSHKRILAHLLFWLLYTAWQLLQYGWDNRDYIHLEYSPDIWI